MTMTIPVTIELDQDTAEVGASATLDLPTFSITAEARAQMSWQSPAYCTISKSRSWSPSTNGSTATSPTSSRRLPKSFPFTG